MHHSQRQQEYRLIYFSRQRLALWACNLGGLYHQVANHKSRFTQKLLLGRSPQKIRLADLYPIMAQNRIGRGHVEIEIRQDKIQQIRLTF